MRTEELHRREESHRTEETKKEEPKLGRLVANGEWERLGESSEFWEKNGEDRILTTMSAVDNKIQILEEPFYNVVRTDTAGGGVILAKIKHLRYVKEALGQELVENIQGQRAPKVPVRKAA